MNDLPFKILGIEHVGIAVEDLTAIHEIFGSLLGLKLSKREKIDDQEVITDIYPSGSVKLEFLKATSEDSPIAHFKKRGKGCTTWRSEWIIYNLHWTIFPIMGFSSLIPIRALGQRDLKLHFSTPNPPVGYW